MNRDIIKKFREAFEWWLGGGEVWLRYKDDKEWKLTDMPYFDESFIYVPDDEFAELRKSWYDGKRLQYSVLGSKGIEWKDWDLNRCPGEKDFEEADFRIVSKKQEIKPDEGKKGNTMTREEALKKYVGDNDNCFGVFDMIKNAINEIYDDFESRICKNCKWLYKGQFEDEFWCANPKNRNISEDGMLIEETFGCNQFERRDNYGKGY